MKGKIGGRATGKEACEKWRGVWQSSLSFSINVRDCQLVVARDRLSLAQMLAKEMAKRQSGKQAGKQKKKCKLDLHFNLITTSELSVSVCVCVCLAAPIGNREPYTSEKGKPILSVSQFIELGM